MTVPTSVMLLQRWRDSGDEQAVAEFLRRYFARLAALVRQRFSNQLQQRLDPEDVAQSACRTFFIRIRDGRIQIDADREPWQLLAQIAVRKLFRQFELHGAGKRSLGKERNLSDVDGGQSARADGVDPAPTPEEALAFEEELDWVLQRFQPRHRDMIGLYLQEFTMKEIAVRTSRTERTVREAIRCFKEVLQQRLSHLTE